MGWIPWEDELEKEPDQKLIEAIGDDYSGEINASKIKNALKKYPKDTLIVFRNVFLGNEKVIFPQLNRPPYSHLIHLNPVTN